jgi:hypothetical protein
MFDSPHDWGRFPLGILTTGVLAEAWGQGIVAGLGAQGNLTEFYLNEILHWGVPTASGVYNPPVFGEIDGISWDRSNNVYVQSKQTGSKTNFYNDARSLQFIQNNEIRNVEPCGAPQSGRSKWTNEAWPVG